MAQTAYTQHLNLGGNQLLSPLFQLVTSDVGSPASGQFWYRTDIKRLRVYDGTTSHSAAWLDDPLNTLGTPTGDLSMGTHKITNLVDPTNPQDAATKNYVDNAINGLDWKPNAQWASAAALPANAATSTTLTGTSNGALLVDGGNPTVNQRVVVKNEGTGANNGIYLVTQPGDGSHPYILTRTADGSTGELTSGAAIAITGGTGATNNNTSWILTTADPITVGTTPLTFSFLPGAGAVGGANLGSGQGVFQGMSGTNLQFYSFGSGNTAIGVSLASSVITFTFVAANVDKNTLGGSALTVVNGGTGAATAAGARTNLGATTKYAASVGDGSSTTITVTHNLGTTDIVATLMDASGNMVGFAWQAPTTNTIVLSFNVAPTTNQYRLVVIG